MVNVCNARPYFKRLLIKCPTQFITDLACDPNWFETVNGNNFFRLMLQPGEYTAIRKGEASRYERYFSSVRLIIKQMEIGFTVNLKESNVKQRYLLEKIAEVSITSGYQTHIATEVWDFINPDRKDFEYAVKYKAESGVEVEPYTIRFGKITVDPPQGSAGFGTDFYTENNLRFTFEQIKQKVI